MSPHYDRHSVMSALAVARREIKRDAGDDAMSVAAEALRQAEVEAVRIDKSTIDYDTLDIAGADELRTIAAALGVPDPDAYDTRDQLVTVIRQRIAFRIPR